MQISFRSQTTIEASPRSPVLEKTPVGKSRSLCIGALLACVLLTTPVVVTAGDDVSTGEPATPSSISVPSSRIVNNSSTGRARMEALHAAASIDGAELDVAVLDLVTGDFAHGDPPGIPILSASLSKLVVAIDIVDRRRGGGITVESRDVDLIRRALGPSDDLAMNELWTRFDGFGAVERVSNTLGLMSTWAPVDPGFWGGVRTTAADVAVLYQHILTMPEADRDLIVNALSAAPPVAADGFAQNFGLLAPQLAFGSVTKQGWMCCDGQSSYLHSAGLFGHDRRFVTVLLSRQQFERNWQTQRDYLTAIAGAVEDVLNFPDRSVGPRA